jgi:type II secretory pathway component PulJ
MRARKAYTLIEMMLVIVFVPMALTLIISLFRLISNYNYALLERQNFIAVIQLRKRVALGSDIATKEDRLIMTYDNREIELICESDKVIERDGYMEYLTGLDECRWQIEDHLIYLDYEIDSVTYRIFIGYEA